MSVKGIDKWQCALCGHIGVTTEHLTRHRETEHGIQVGAPNAVPNADLRAEVRKAWIDFKGRGWAFAKMAAQVADEQWWASWHFKSLAEWAQHDLHMSPSTARRYAEAGRFLLAASPDQQVKLLQSDIWCAAEALSSRFGKANPEAAYELATSGKSQQQIRQTIRDGETDQHHDSGQYRTFSVRYPIEIRDLVQRALHRARFECGKTDPSPAELLEVIFSRFVDEPLERESDRLAIESGEACCSIFKRPELRDENCGGWNRNVIDRHHLQSRALGGGAGPVIAICRSCHQKWEDGGKWRELAHHLGYEEIATAEYGGEAMWGENDGYGDLIPSGESDGETVVDEPEEIEAF